MKHTENKIKKYIKRIDNQLKIKYSYVYRSHMHTRTKVIIQPEYGYPTLAQYLNVTTPEPAPFDISLESLIDDRGWNFINDRFNNAPQPVVEEPPAAPAPLGRLRGRRSNAPQSEPVQMAEDPPAAPVAPPVPENCCSRTDTHSYLLPLITRRTIGHQYYMYLQE